MRFVNVPIDVQPARLQIVMRKSFSERRTAGMFAAFCYVASSAWRCVGHENVCTRWYPVIQLLGATLLVLERPDGVERCSLYQGYKREEGAR